MTEPNVNFNSQKTPKCALQYQMQRHEWQILVSPARSKRFKHVPATWVKICLSLLLTL